MSASHGGQNPECPGTEILIAHSSPPHGPRTSVSPVTDHRHSTCADATSTPTAESHLPLLTHFKSHLASSKSQLASSKPLVSQLKTPTSQLKTHQDKFTSCGPKFKGSSEEPANRWPGCQRPWTVNPVHPFQHPGTKASYSPDQSTVPPGPPTAQQAIFRRTHRNLAEGAPVRGAPRRRLHHSPPRPPMHQTQQAG